MGHLQWSRVQFNWWCWKKNITWHIKTLWPVNCDMILAKFSFCSLFWNAYVNELTRCTWCTKGNKNAGAQGKKPTFIKKQTVTYHYHKICQFPFFQPWNSFFQYFLNVFLIPQIRNWYTQQSNTVSNRQLHLHRQLILKHIPYFTTKSSQKLSSQFLNPHFHYCMHQLPIRGIRKPLDLFN